MVTLDAEAVSRVLFHPRREAQDGPTAGMPTTTSCDGAQISGYLHEVAASPTLVLFFHGNGELARDYDGLASTYTACGASFWFVDYRGYGRSTGRPSFSNMLEDAEALFDDAPRVAALARAYYTNLVVMGRSLGSAPAIHLASSQPEQVHGLILDSPFASGPDLVRRLGGPRVPKAALSGFQDNLDKMRSCQAPTLILHGTRDRIIPVAEGEALHRACASAEKRFVTIDGAGHNTLLQAGYRTYFAEIRARIERIAQAGRGP